MLLPLCVIMTLFFFFFKESTIFKLYNVWRRARPCSTQILMKVLRSPCQALHVDSVSFGCAPAFHPVLAARRVLESSRSTANVSSSCRICQQLSTVRERERERVHGFLFWKVLEAFSPTVSTVWNGAPALCWSSFQDLCPTCLQFTEEEEKGGGKDTPRPVPLWPKFALQEAFQEFCPLVCVEFTAKLLNHRSHQLSVGKCSKAFCPKVSTDHWSRQFSDGNLLSARKRPQFTTQRGKKKKKKKQWERKKEKNPDLFVGTC